MASAVRTLETSASHKRSFYVWLLVIAVVLASVITYLLYANKQAETVAPGVTSETAIEIQDSSSDSRK